MSTAPLSADDIRRLSEELAAEAEREGLDPLWLNDAVKGYLHGPDPNAVRFFEAPGLWSLTSRPLSTSSR